MSDKPALSVVAKFPEEKVQKPKWTPLSMLEEFVEEVRSGKVNPDCVMVFYMETDPATDRLRPHYWTQNVSHIQQIAYGQMIVQMAVDDWRA